MHTDTTCTVGLCLKYAVRWDTDSLLGACQLNTQYTLGTTDLVTMREGESLRHIFEWATDQGRANSLLVTSLSVQKILSHCVTISNQHPTPSPSLILPLTLELGQAITLAVAATLTTLYSTRAPARSPSPSPSPSPRLLLAPRLAQGDGCL